MEMYQSERHRSHTSWGGYCMSRRVSETRLIKHDLLDGFRYQIGRGCGVGYCTETRYGGWAKEHGAWVQQWGLV